MSNNNSALLVMDMQVSVVGRYENANLIIENIRKAITYARNSKITVIYVTVGFRPGMPEVSESNKVFYASKLRAGSVDTTPFMKIHSDLAPESHDIIVTKHRFSAFSGSDLEMILKSLKINHLILSGIATSGVVLSTVREASDKDYVLTVLSDACTDDDIDVHNVLTTKVFPAQSDVLSTDAWIQL